MMQGVATVFIANVYGIDLSLTDYLMVVLTATLGSVGTAAIPAVGLVTLTMVLDQAVFDDPEAGSVEAATRHALPPHPAA